MPEFDKAIADLKPNEISQRSSKTRYGWHIVQIRSEDSHAYDSTDDVRRQKAFAAIRESKGRRRRPSFGFAGCATRRSSKSRCRRLSD